jgi:hypothetical protein
MFKVLLTLGERLHEMIRQWKDGMEHKEPRATKYGSRKRQGYSYRSGRRSWRATERLLLTLGVIDRRY